MRPEMQTIYNGLRSIPNKWGCLVPFGFSTDEIVEVILYEMDVWRAREAERLEEEWAGNVKISPEPFPADTPPEAPQSLQTNDASVRRRMVFPDPHSAIERENAFFAEGVSREWAFEVRGRYLRGRFEQAVRAYEEERLEGEAYAAKLPTGATREFVLLGNCERLEELAYAKAKAKFRYDCHYAVRKDHLTEADIKRAHSIPMAMLISTKHGFALCPFHKEKTPSFHVTPKNFWHCFGCGESGNPISFIRKTKHLSFREAVEYLCRA